MVPRFVLLVVLIGLAGCGSSFENESQELRYLESLSNPSPLQFKRREELQSKRAAAEEVRARELDALNAKLEKEQEIEERKRQEEMLVQERLQEKKRHADEGEKRFGILLNYMKEHPEEAEFIVRRLNTLSTEYYDTPTADRARQRLPEWEARVKGGKP